jgi:hypothetical protein
LFLAVFPLASKLALFTVQYLTTRVIVVRRRRRALGRAARTDGVAGAMAQSAP